MRITPLAMWASNLVACENPNYKAFKQVISVDVSFTHPLPIVHEASFVYSALIAQLLNSKTVDLTQRAHDAVVLAYTLAQSDLADTVEYNDGNSKDLISILTWLNEADDLCSKANESKNNYYLLQNPDAINTRVMLGYVKHAFILTFYYLMNFAMN